MNARHMRHKVDTPLSILMSIYSTFCLRLPVLRTTLPMLLRGWSLRNLFSTALAAGSGCMLFVVFTLRKRKKEFPKLL